MNAATAALLATEPKLTIHCDFEHKTCYGMLMPNHKRDVIFTCYHDTGTVTWEIRRIPEFGYMSQMAHGTLEDMDDPAEIMSAIMEEAGWALNGND